MMEYLNTPVFGVTLTIIAFMIATWTSKKLRIQILNPLLVSIIIIIGFLSLTGIDIETYNKGGSIISFFLAPATVALAVPLFRQWELLKKNLVPILVGISFGTIMGILSILILGKVFGLGDLLISSLLPKSTTTPIAMEISNMLGGNPSLTVIFVFATGIGGYIVGDKLLRLFKINNSIAKGIAIGTASHAVGTAKAIEMGEVEGAMSSLAIGVAGVITVLLVPLIILFIN